MELGLKAERVLVTAAPKGIDRTIVGGALTVRVQH
jgi:hypothetical protein